MNPITRWLLASIGVFLVLLGLGCLNFTKADGLEHHTRFATEHGLPKPSETILWSGALAILAGSGLIGYLAGNAQCTNRTKLGPG